MLCARGWSRQTRVGRGRKFRIDFKKASTGIEVEFRQGTNLIHDLLKLASRAGSISSGIIITYDRSVAIVGQHSMGACLQDFDELMTEFHGIIAFQLPLWVIGLLENS
jgi:hypothetical protein